ncbi:SDR family oxidoreductase [Paenibacillus mesotrionivorans]|uniref:SDR family oxidoreductase n=1 Tax=Paenibacillus mesotrionivorans TaxID=3160968 RepID=A0ACC7NTX3_9BACL
MKIVITGATGALGGHVIRHLLQTVPAAHIVAVARHPEKAAALAELGVEIRQGDYDDPSSLASAFQGGTKLLFISSPSMDDALRVVQHAQVVKAARDAGVRHIAYTGFAFAEDNPFALVHLATEYAIRAAGIPYTFLRNAGYLEFFVNPAAVQANLRSGRIITNSGQGRVNAVSRYDLALAAATVLTGEGHENKTYTLVSGAPWSFDELAGLLTELSGTTVAHQAVSFEEEKRMLVQAGLPEAVAQMTAYIYSTVSEGKMERGGSDLARLIGSETPLREHIRGALQE